MWLILLYGTAAVIALRMLLPLMQHHRMQYRKKLQRELARHNDELADQQAEEQLFSAINNKNAELQEVKPAGKAA